MPGGGHVGRPRARRHVVQHYRALCPADDDLTHRTRARSLARADETLRDISPPREIPPFAIKFKLQDVERAADPQNDDY